MLITQSGSPDAVEGPRHERVVVGRVGEDHELGAAEAVVVPGPLGRILQDVAQSARIASMLMPGGRRADVHRGADALGRREDLGQASRSAGGPLGPALLHQRGEAADEVDADLGGHGVERPGDGEVALGRVRRRRPTRSG